VPMHGAAKCGARRWHQCAMCPRLQDAARAVELIGLGHGRPRSVRSQDAHLAPRRVTDLQGHTIVCEPSPVLMAYYRYDVDLRDAIFTG
jgi:hypothetical protein